MVPPPSYGIPRVPHYSGFRLLLSRFSYRTFTVSGQASQTCSDHAILLLSVLTPRLFPNSVWALSLSLAATQKIDYFLSLPTGTKMFQFPAYAPRYRGARPSARRVPPFGCLRINSCLQIPGAFRSLPRPSSLPEA